MMEYQCSRMTLAASQTSKPKFVFLIPLMERMKLSGVTRSHLFGMFPIPCSIIRAFVFAVCFSFDFPGHILVGAERLELSTSSSQTMRATNCATPRHRLQVYANFCESSNQASQTSARIFSSALRLLRNSISLEEPMGFHRLKGTRTKNRNLSVFSSVSGKKIRRYNARMHSFCNQGEKRTPAPRPRIVRARHCPKRDWIRNLVGFPIVSYQN